MFKQKRTIVALVLSILLSFPAVAFAGKSIGKITRLKGRVTIYRNGARVGQSAKNGMTLQQNDKIKTRARAYLRFKLKDGSIMTLGQKTELTLDKFTYDPKKKERVAFFKVALGKLRVFANRMLKYRDNRFQVKTPTAVAGVRGTVFMVWVQSPTVTRVACFDSAVEVSSVDKPGEIVVITKNIATSVSKGAAPSQPVLMTEKTFKAFQGGFEGNIKPVDAETGFKDDGGDDSGDNDQREAPDPTEMDIEPPVVEPPEIQEVDPVSVPVGDTTNDEQPDSDPEPEPGEDFDPEDPRPEPEPEPKTLPAPPDVPSL